MRKFIYPHIKFLNYKEKETKERAFYSPPLNNVAQNLQIHIDNASTQDTCGNKDSIFLHIQMNTSYMPRSVKAVFEENIQLLPRVQTTQARQVHDAVRKFIHPHIKLLNHKDKETKERSLDILDNH